MSKVDDELTRRLRRAERPVDGDGLFEGLAQRRSQRERVRRVQGVSLAFAVLAATAVGFSALTGLFDPDGRGTLAITPYGAEGAIVICGDETGGQVCRIDAAALARGATSDDFIGLTDLPQGLVTSPAVSHDGTTVVFELHDPPGTSRRETAELWTIGTDGTGLRRLTARGSGFTEASWGPTGLLIAVAGDGVSGDAALAILDPSAGPSPRVATIDLPGLTFPSSPKWSPDNERILFAATAEPIIELYTVAIDGSDLTHITNSPETENSPTWSPDGRSIAFWVGSPNGEEIRICPADCSQPRALLDAEGRPIDGTLPAWSPEGDWIAFQIVESDQEPAIHAVRIDGSDERTLVSPAGEIAWIPLAPSGLTPSPPPVSEGRDIGLGFNLCNLERLGGIDWYGDGTEGSAWTGARTTVDGRCPSESDGGYVVAADLDGDGSAESGGMGFLEHCLLCRPFAATDLNADGVLELVALEEASSTPSFSIYEVSLPTSERSPGIYTLFVAAPGYPAGGFPGNEPIRFLAGGDEGYSAAIRCEGYPEAPVLVVAWSNYQVDADITEDVYVTRLRLGEDSVFQVIAREHLRQPVGDPLPIDPAGKACGVDFDPF